MGLLLWFRFPVYHGSLPMQGSGQFPVFPVFPPDDCDKFG